MNATGMMMLFVTPLPPGEPEPSPVRPAAGLSPEARLAMFMEPCLRRSCIVNMMNDVKETVGSMRDVQDEPNNRVYQYLSCALERSLHDLEETMTEARDEDGLGGPVYSTIDAQHHCCNLRSMRWTIRIRL